MVAQNERRVEQFTRQSDGSWRLVETVGEGEVRLNSVGCVLTLADVYSKVVFGPMLRLVSEEPR